MNTAQQIAPRNMMHNTFRNAFLAITIGLLAGCSSGVKLDDSAGAPVEDRAGTLAGRNQPGAGTDAGGSGSVTPPPPPADSRSVAKVDVAVDPLNNPTGPLALRSIYFDYDSFVVTEKFRPVVDAHSRYLLQNKARKVVIQGNADERGGSEYNLALGQKRAEAVRRNMQLLGVPETQMEAVSFGKEKPKALGSNEAAWAENRRADLVYP